MSEIAEIRKIFQDLIAPDVKSIGTELASFKGSVDKQFGAAEALAQARYTTVLVKLETMEAIQSARHDAIIKALDIDKRWRKSKLDRQHRLPRTVLIGMAGSERLLPVGLRTVD